MRGVGWGYRGFERGGNEDGGECGRRCSWGGEDGGGYIGWKGCGGGVLVGEGG